MEATFKSRNFTVTFELDSMHIPVRVAPVKGLNSEARKFLKTMDDRIYPEFQKVLEFLDDFESSLRRYVLSKIGG